MDRLIIFGDSKLSFSARLAEAAMEAASRRSDLDIVGICDAGFSKPLPKLIRELRIGLGIPAAAAFNPQLRAGMAGYSAMNLYDLARRHDVRIVVPPGRDINAEPFVESLRHRYRPTLALSLGCRQIFTRDLLGIFEMAVNCHDALLPEYRGVNATDWSCYKGESRTGFTYHVMNEGIDTGPILIQGSLKAADFKDVREIKLEKIRLARESAGDLLELMVSRAPGRPQEGRGTYFGKKAFREIVTVGDLSRLTWEEVQKRLESFGFLMVGRHGETLPVTAFSKTKATGAKGKDLTFTTGDGITVHASRFHHFPLPLYRVLRALGMLWL